MIKRISFQIITIVVCLLISGCANKENESEEINWSVSKHSDITEKDFEEVQGYKAAFLNTDELTLDIVKEWIDSCELNDGYYSFINSDPDSWEMYIYYPCKTNNNNHTFNFYVAESCVSVYVESLDTSVEKSDYILLLIQAPLRGAWPSSSRLFLDKKEIDLISVTIAD